MLLWTALYDGGCMDNFEKPLRGSPAGRPSDTGGQQPEGVLILNARDERTLAWCVEQVGFDAVREACTKLAGSRKSYPSNLARILGLSIPQSVVNTPKPEALEHIRKLRILLSGKQS